MIATLEILAGPERAGGTDAIVQDQCWCTHVCFIHDSLRHSPKVLLYDIPKGLVESRLGLGAASSSARAATPAHSPLTPLPGDAATRR